MKATLISCSDKVLEQLRSSVEAEGYAVGDSLVRADKQPLQPLLDNITSDLLILDSTGGEQLTADLQILEACVNAHPGLTVIVLSPTRDADTLTAAMRAGVREVLPSPPAPADLAATLRRFAQRPANGGAAPVKRGRVIAFITCKGGSGATFLATNLAHLLASEYQKETAFLDLDLQFGDASFYVAEGPGKSDLTTLTQQIDRVDAKLLSASMLHIAPMFSLLPAPEAPETALTVTASQLERVLEVAQGSYDVVVLDLERFLDGMAIKALDMADHVFLVMENLMPYVRDAKRLVRVCRALGYPDDKMHLIVNRYEKGGAIDLAQIEKAVGLPVFRTIPNSFADVAQAINTGVSLAKVNPHNPVVQALREIAAEITGSNMPRPHGWFDRLFGKNK